MAAMEAGKEVIKVAEIEKSAPAKKATNHAAYLTGKSGLKAPTTIAAMKVDLRDSEAS